MIKKITFRSEFFKDQEHFIRKFWNWQIRSLSNQNAEVISCADSPYLLFSYFLTKIEVVDACQGDSGGPLLCRYTKRGSITDLRHYLTGIVSTGSKCGSEVHPGIYTPLSNYWYWIKLIADKRKISSFDPKKVCTDKKCE